MIVLILAAGKGERLNNKYKCTILVKDKPIIQYSLDSAVPLKPEKIIIVTSRLGYFELHNLFGDQYKNISIDYEIQDKPTGTMDAIKTGMRGRKPPFFLMLGDEILVGGRTREMLIYYNGSPYLDGLLGYLEEKNHEEIKKTYNIISQDHFIKKLVEKPKEVVTNLKGTGYCIIGKKLLEKMVSSREENFVEAIDYAIRERCLVEGYRVCNKYFNINTQNDLVEAKEELE
jgi:dTDP-glucose pyrophosphorylase